MKKVFEYISGMTQKLYEVKCIDARISELKSNIEAIKLEIEGQKQKEGELKTEFSDLLTQADTYGLTRKSAQSVVEENLETMIGNGILTIESSDKIASDASQVVEPKPRRTRKSKNVEVAPEEPTPELEAVTLVEEKEAPEAVVVVTSEEPVSEVVSPVETVLVDDGVAVVEEPVSEVVEELNDAPVSEAVVSPAEAVVSEPDVDEDSQVKTDDLVAASVENVVEKAEDGDADAQAEVKASASPAPMSMPKVPAFLTMRKK